MRERKEEQKNEKSVSKNEEGTESHVCECWNWNCIWPGNRMRGKEEGDTNDLGIVPLRA